MDEVSTAQSELARGVDLNLTFAGLGAVEIAVEFEGLARVVPKPVRVGPS